jgi:hypothetical protein
LTDNEKWAKFIEPLAKDFKTKKRLVAYAIDKFSNKDEEDKK